MLPTSSSTACNGQATTWSGINLKSVGLNDPGIGKLRSRRGGGRRRKRRTYCACSFVGSAVPIAVLPLGTANNLALILDAGKHDLLDRIARVGDRPVRRRHVEFDRNRGLVLRRIRHRRVRRNRGGADRAGSRWVRRKQSRSELARDIAALCERSRKQTPFEAEVHVDGKVIFASLLMLEVLNIGRLGPNVELAPGVDPADGSLDVVLVEEARRDAVDEVPRGDSRPAGALTHRLQPSRERDSGKAPVRRRRAHRRQDLGAAGLRRGQTRNPAACGPLPGRLRRADAHLIPQAPPVSSASFPAAPAPSKSLFVKPPALCVI